MERNEKQQESDLPEPKNSLLKLYDINTVVGLQILQDKSIEDLFVLTRVHPKDYAYAKRVQLWRQIAIAKHGEATILDFEQLLQTPGKTGFSKTSVCESFEQIDHFRIMLVLHVVKLLANYKGIPLCTTTTNGQHEFCLIERHLGLDIENRFAVNFTTVKDLNRLDDWTVQNDNAKMRNYIVFACLQEENGMNISIMIMKNTLTCQPKDPNLPAPKLKFTDFDSSLFDLRSLYRILYRIFSHPKVKLVFEKKLFDLTEVGEGEQKKLLHLQKKPGKTTILVRNKV